MSRRRRISDLPIPGFDRAVRSSFNSAFNLFSAAVGLGYLAYKNATSVNYYTDSYGYNSNPGYNYLMPQPIYKKSQFKDEINQIEQAIHENHASLKQCERLGRIYSLVGDSFKERYARLCAIRCFLIDNGLDSKVDSFIDSFNDPCKRPPDKISEDEAINAKYRELLNKAEIAKRKCQLKFIRK
jgi:hypothetical protein